MCLTLGLMFSKREKRLAVYEMRNVKLNICVLLVYTHMSTPYIGAARADAACL